MLICDKLSENELGARASANISVTNEHNFYHKKLRFKKYCFNYTTYNEKNQHNHRQYFYGVKIVNVIFGYSLDKRNL